MRADGAGRDGVEGAIVGTALYEGAFTLEDALALTAAGTRPMSLAVRVIPCLDVDAGRVVKGINFRSSATPATRSSWRRSTTPRAPTSSRFLDISASHEGRATTLEIVSRTAEQVFIPLTVGGGVGSVDDVDRLLRAGADKVAVNTAAIQPAGAGRRDRRPVRQPGAGAVGRRPARAAGTDVGFEVTTHGGRSRPGSTRSSGPPRGAELGAGEILLNSMDADGTQDGFDLEMIRAGPRRGRRSR